MLRWVFVFCSGEKQVVKRRKASTPAQEESSIGAVIPSPLAPAAWGVQPIAGPTRSGLASPWLMATGHILAILRAQGCFALLLIARDWTRRERVWNTCSACSLVGQNIAWCERNDAMTVRIDFWNHQRMQLNVPSLRLCSPTTGLRPWACMILHGIGSVKQLLLDISIIK